MWDSARLKLSTVTGTGAWAKTAPASSVNSKASLVFMGWLLFHSFHRRWHPDAVPHRPLRGIKAQRKIELSLRRREPVRRLFRTGRLVLDIEIQRAIGIERELVIAEVIA